MPKSAKVAKKKKSPSVIKKTPNKKKQVVKKKKRVEKFEGEENSGGGFSLASLQRMAIPERIMRVWRKLKPTFQQYMNINPIPGLPCNHVTREQRLGRDEQGRPALLPEEFWNGEDIAPVPGTWASFVRFMYDSLESGFLDISHFSETGADAYVTSKAFNWVGERLSIMDPEGPLGQLYNVLRTWLGLPPVTANQNEYNENVNMDEEKLRELLESIQKQQEEDALSKEEPEENKERKIMTLWDELFV